MKSSGIHIQYLAFIALTLNKLIFLLKVISQQSNKTSTGVPPYPRVTRFMTYRGYLKPLIIPNAIYNVIFV
jgi:hypothetical protein